LTAEHTELLLGPLCWRKLCSDNVDFSWTSLVWCK